MILIIFVYDTIIIPIYRKIKRCATIPRSRRRRRRRRIVYFHERETSGGVVQGSIQFNEARRRDNPDAIDCSSPRIVEPKPMSRWDRSTPSPSSLSSSSSFSSLFVRLSRLLVALDVVQRLAVSDDTASFYSGERKRTHARTRTRFLRAH